MSDERKPGGGFGKKPFGKKPFGKKPFGGGKKFGDRGPRSEGGDRPFRKKPWGDRGPRAEGGERPFRKSFADRGPRPEGDRGDRPFRKKAFGDHGPRPEGGDRPFRKSFGDRGPRPEGDRGDRPFRKKRFAEGEQFNRGSDRAPREWGDKPRRDYNDRGDGNKFRGMYGRPDSGERREWREKRGYRPDPRPERHSLPTPNDAPAAQEAESQERPHLGENELRYHGKNACLALLQKRSRDLIRAYILKEKAEEYAPLIEFCAKNQLAYHLVEERDLEKLSDSIHHQGVVVIAKMKRFFKEEFFFKELGAHRTLVIYLDGVANPHNLGAILRTAAHFGVKWVCVPADEITKISPALYRTAEGGAETVNLVRVEDAEKFLDRLQSAGFQLYAFEPAARAIPLFETRLNEKSVFVFGAEVEGLSGLVKTIVETKVTIPGTGEVESLNVSVAAAVAMAEFERQGITPRAVRIVKSKA
jgi:TrmH RNA methyltransferase